MDWQSRKLTRRSLLGRLGVGRGAAAAGGTLFNEKTAFAAAAPGTVAASAETASAQPPRPERAGTLIVKPKAGKTIAEINARFGTRTVLTFAGKDRGVDMAVVATSRILM